MAAVEGESSGLINFGQFLSPFVGMLSLSRTSSIFERGTAMQRTLISFALVIATVWSVFGQAPGKQANSKASTEKEIAQLERNWSAAMSRRDLTALERMLADDVMVAVPGVSTGATKMEYLELLNKRRIEVAKLKETIDDFKVAVHGDTAVALGEYNWRTETDGKSETGKAKFMDVAIKRDGRWQFVALSRMPIASQDKTPQISALMSER
jgi:ketosteroid isomerase-like protein